eukprot:514661-Prorocentrum_minimum.AAC.2
MAQPSVIIPGIVSAKPPAVKRLMPRQFSRSLSEELNSLLQEGEEGSKSLPNQVCKSLETPVVRHTISRVRAALLYSY